MEVVCNTKKQKMRDRTCSSACSPSHVLKLLACLSINHLYVVHIIYSQLTIELSV